MILDRKFLKFFEHHQSLLKRYLSAKKNSFTAQCLKERSLLQISGNDANVYLQGLITNDMKHLQDGVSSMFALFLNSKGRVLYDSLIYKGKNENIYFIECDADGASFLKDHLLRYKVRRKITVESLENDYDVWAVINSDNFNVFNYKDIVDVMKQNLKDMVVTIDPRLSCLGLRVLAPKNINICNEVKNKTNLEISEENFYKGLRYKLGIGEGLQELPSEKCFPMEINGDYLHGISFHKGCYIGQELTARTYHTGVIRKRLMPLIFNEELKISESGIPIFAVPQGAKSIGKLQGIEQNTGVGLLRIEEALKADELMVLDKKCKTHRPFWWPTEAPKERMNIG